VELDLDAPVAVQLLGLARVSVEEPLRNAHHGLDLLHEGSKVEAGLGPAGGNKKWSDCRNKIELLRELGLFRLLLELSRFPYGGVFDNVLVFHDVCAGHPVVVAVGHVHHNRLAHGRAPPVAGEGQVHVVEDEGFAADRDRAVATREIADLAPERITNASSV
jgi:hypothetical protein